MPLIDEQCSGFVFAGEHMADSITVLFGTVLTDVE